LARSVKLRIIRDGKKKKILEDLAGRGLKTLTLIPFRLINATALGRKEGHKRGWIKKSK